MDLQTVPYYAKSTIILLGVCLLIAVLYIAQGLLIPLAYGVFLAILLYPVDRWLEAHHIHRIIAITIALILSAVVLGLLGLLIYDQLARFSENSAQLSDKFQEIWTNIQNYVREKFGMSKLEQARALKEMTSKGVESTGLLIGTALGYLEAIVLVPIYAWLFLYYRELFEEFLLRLFVKEGSLEEVREVLRKNSTILFGYLIGKAIETVIVAALSWLGLYLMDIQYAVLFGIIAGILNLIPFIGVQVSALLPMLMAMLTKDSLWYPLGVAGMFTVVQFIDNHFIIPLVVGPKISINAFWVVVVLVAGGMLWGVSGMVLSMPMTAMLKVIFDNVPKLRPWGMVLGSKMPSEDKQLRQKE